MSSGKSLFDAKAFVRSLTAKPGVYRMLNADGTVLYVGKARNLRNRVGSYFRSAAALSPKNRAMVAQVASVEVTVTRTEGEAMLLESNLIKELKPRYNIDLRDDKSYPYIYLTSHQEFPRLAFHRGARTGPGRYFGPYPNAGAVRQTLALLQKLFLVRQCEDNFFRNRNRPCLQYQIKRCTAPCVGYVDAETYRQDVEHAVMFLEGRSQQVIDDLVRRMEDASRQLQFERAARYRDQILALQRVQQRQYVSSEQGDIDIIAAATREGVGCIQVFYIRGGRNLGNKTFFPRLAGAADAAELLAAFLPQFYLAGSSERTIPRRVLVNQAIADRALLAEVLSDKAGHKVDVAHEVRGERARWLDMAVQNAEIALGQRLSSQASVRERLDALQEALGLDEPVGRIECFDISHTRGEATVASCVVFGLEGPVKSDYRRFNIEDIEPGDDYAAMRQAINRRYTRVKKEEGPLPDVLLIDGGKGQVGQAREVLEALQVEGVFIVGVAKGPSRKPGLEDLMLPGRDAPVRLSPDSPALHLIQQVRDEAHRFAITGHRQRRSRARNTSPLEEITGIGGKRRQRLIRHFGGMQGVARAGVEDLTKVPGISRQLAQKIYDSFHDGP